MWKTQLPSTIPTARQGISDGKTFSADALEASLISASDSRRFTDRYFTNSRQACEHQGYSPKVLYQVFQRHDAILCGMKYVLELFSAFGNEVQLYGLADGDSIAPREPVLHIIGPCVKLFELE